jgi:hypothetical protein
VTVRWGNYVIVNPSHWGKFLIADRIALLLPSTMPARGIEAIGWPRRPCAEPPRTGSVGSRWLAVDEHVVGLVRHIDDRSGPGVAGTGRATPPAVLRRSTSTTCDSRTPMA